jgi:hypothetical protein
MDPKRELLRHTVATLAYRGEKAIRKASKRMANFRAGKTTRSGREILSHIGDLLEWALSMSSGKPRWNEVKSETWAQASRRFFSGLKKLDKYLAGAGPLANPPEKIFQGPIADALTHVGQLATLRRLSGSPVMGENYFRAQIVIGRVGSAQSTKRVEFE